MSTVRKVTSIGGGALLSTLSLCLLSASAAAADPASSVLQLASDSIGLGPPSDPALAPTDSQLPMVLDSSAGLNFDLGGSETRKLQLVLDEPLSLQAGAGLDARVSDAGSDLLGLDATLNLPVTKQFGVGATIDRRLANARFQPLGSIQCMNGTLRADSYTASGCRFVNEPLASSEQQQIGLGAYLNLSGASASINWFTRSTEVSQAAGPWVTTAATPILSDGLLSPTSGNPLLSSASDDPLQYLNSEASGVNLNFKVGITTDTRGDLQLGLAFSRVFEADYYGLYSQYANTLAWTLAEPFNTARMNLEWSRGSFSSGIQGYYRDSVNLLNGNVMDDMTTFDVHFTWRTPWNANLSVGATNVLNAGPDANVSTESQPVDPLESIYGRIPYVRYKQDL